ncbi:MAG: TetR/AcrR family transcriptional regulator [Saonia sp.]
MYTEKGQQTKEHFIRISADLFNKKGYAGTAISDILDTAGYSKGALYRIFKDKDEIAVEAFKYNLGIMYTQLQDAIAVAEKDVDKILAIPRFYKNIDGKKFVQGGCPILNTAIEADDTHPQLNHLASNAFVRMSGLIEETLTRAKGNKSITETIDPKIVAQYMVATIEGSIAMMKSIGKKDIMKNNMIYLEKTILQQL